MSCVCAMSISCSVVSYCNAPEQISHVLGCIAASEAVAAIYLVDNSPQDQLAEVARRHGAIYIHLPHNPGFGAAHNVAIKAALAAGSVYHAVLNPDIHFDSHVMQAMHDYMQDNPNIGLLMPGIVYPDGRRQYLCKLLPHPVDLLMRRFSPALYQRSGRLANYELHGSGYQTIMDVPSLSGCFMLLRSAILQRTGGFDERYFMYLEDVDLSRRIGQVARTVYFPAVSVVHDYVKGSYKNRKLLIYHIQSAIRYFNKWGWFFDRERRAVNRRTLSDLQKIINSNIKIVK